MASPLEKDNIHPDDNALHRVLFVDMTPDQQKEWLAGMNARRLVTINKRKEMEGVKLAARSQRLRERIDDALRMMDKELDQLNRAFDKVEKRATLLAALRLNVEAEQSER